MNDKEWNFTHMSRDLKEYPSCCEMIWDGRKHGGSSDNYISIFNGFSFTNRRYCIVAVGNGAISYRTFREDPDVTKVYRVDYTSLEPIGEPLPDDIKEVFEKALYMSSDFNNEFTVLGDLEEVNNTYHTYLPPEARSFAKYYGFGKDEYIVPKDWK